MTDATGRPQTVLVLGGGSEIGLAIAERLAAGARSIVLAARRPDELAGACERLRRAGAGSVEAVEFDAADLASHPGFAERSFERLGDVDLVLLAFGVLGSGDSVDDPEAAASVIHTNLTGAVSVLAAIVPRLRRQGHGRIVVLSSVAGVRVRQANAVYGASKAGLDGYALALGDRLHGTGVRVTVVRPGFVHTAMTAGARPMPLATRPDRVADDVIAGIRRDARVVWSPRPLRALMLVARHLPQPLFRRVSG